MEEKIEKSILEVQKLRRTYTKILDDELSNNQEIEDTLELEDMIRLVGTLEAAYNHLLAAKITGTLYCVYKHLSYALILAGEVGTEVGPIYTIMSLLTDGKIKPCSSCENDRKS